MTEPYDIDERGTPPPAGGMAVPTGAGVDRVGALIATRRWADAERELRRGLVGEPESAWLHARLALVLVAQESDAQRREASDEARRAIGLDPELPTGHYALALSLFHRERPDEAMAAIAEATRLDPYDADYHGLRAACLLGKRDWRGALAAADHGLSLDAENDECLNLRAVALRQLGERDAADATIRGHLRRRPDDAFAHANRGWTALHNGDFRAAETHFREALRLDPGLEYAREGVLESLKARNVVYRGLLKWKLWMSTLSGGRQWAVVIGLYVVYRLVRGVAASNPQLAPLVWPIIALYFGFVLLTWIGDPVFDSLLRLNRFGRLALSDDRRRASNLLLGAAALLGTATAVITLTGNWLWLVPVALLALTTLFASKIWRVAPGWPRRTLAGFVAWQAVLAVAAGGLFAAGSDSSDWGPLDTLAGVLFVAFLIGQIAGWFLVNYLVGVRPRR